MPLPRRKAHACRARVVTNIALKTNGTETHLDHAAGAAGCGCRGRRSAGPLALLQVPAVPRGPHPKAEDSSGPLPRNSVRAVRARSRDGEELPGSRPRLRIFAAGGVLAG